MLYWWEWAHYGVSGAAVLIWAAVGILALVDQVKEHQRRKRYTTAEEDALRLQVADLKRQLLYATDGMAKQQKALSAAIKLLADSPDPKLGKFTP